MTTFFDTSALIALTKETEAQHEWSLNQFHEAKRRGPVVIAPVVFAEFSVSIPTLAEVQNALGGLGIQTLPDREEALFRASRAYLEYKNANKGPKNSLLPDFLIGALAEATGRPLVTTNERDFMNYFKALKIIHPRAE